MRGIAIGIIFFSLISCNRSVNSGGSVDADCQKNETGLYELCVTKSQLNKDGLPRIAYILTSANGDILLNSSLESGYVKWLDENSIEIYQTPGMISTEMDKNDIIRVFDLTTKEFQSKTEYLSSKI